MKLKLALGCLLLFSATTAASAQQAATPPCVRDPAHHVVVGGVDLDEVRCQQAVEQDFLGQLQFTATQMRAKNALLTNDLAAAAQQIQTLTAQVQKLTDDAKAKETPPPVSPSAAK